MTRDDILNMQAGREMDALVAERVMGWHKKKDEFGRENWETEDGHWGAGCGRYPEDDNEFLHTLDWHPSESILWAWEVVEKLHLIIGESVGSDWSHWYCTNRWDEEDATVEVCADTAPLAICRAALLAVADD